VLAVGDVDVEGFTLALADFVGQLTIGTHDGTGFEELDWLALGFTLPLGELLCIGTGPVPVTFADAPTLRTRTPAATSTTVVTITSFQDLALRLLIVPLPS
jgi:hypothetical protein